MNNGRHSITIARHKMCKMYMQQIVATTAVTLRTTKAAFVHNQYVAKHFDSQDDTYEEEYKFCFA